MVWGKSVQLSVLHLKHPSIAGDPEAFQISFQLQLEKYVTLDFITVLQIIKKIIPKAIIQEGSLFFYLALHTCFPASI